MTGYLTIMYEIEDQLNNNQSINFVFLASGVGTWAALVAWYYAHKFTNNQQRPKLICVEPIEADCCLESIKQGKIATSKGNGNTIMAGLNCGTPSKIGRASCRERV